MNTNRLKLKKLRNTRDLGGIATADGRVIKKGKLIRSGRLFALPKSTVEKLKSIGLTTVIDLRVAAECNDHPDTLLPDIKYIQQPLLPTPAGAIAYVSPMRRTMKYESVRFKREFENADEYMKQFYRSVLFTPKCKDAISRFLRLVIDEDGCVLWHCASGKDRTGILSMLLLTLLGVDEQTVLEDYMLSRRCWRHKYRLNRLGLFVLPVSIRFKRILFGFMRTKPEYLMSVMDELKLRYGGIVEYCKAELGVTDADIQILKDKYLTENETD